MACRLAGEIDSPEKLWQSLLERVDASGDIPDMRWEPYYRRDALNEGVLRETTKRGYFLKHLEDFDAAFFGISPKEAEQMDPQQRISLEVAWEALENAGIPPQSLSGTDAAVFMGVNSDDYSKLLLEDLPGIEAWMGIGTAYCGVPNRISYHLNLMGPSTAVDAACASSLVAIHHGRQAILQGECRVAITGGVNALCGPGLTRVLDKAGATTPEGRCRSFDDKAAGYGRGEGAAVVVLKRMADAIMDGDNILAVLKGSAVAQDGRTNGIMAPNAKAQELVAHRALRVAGVDPLTVGYVEAHATSTPLGDPTEVSAIASVYSPSRPADEPLLIGSVKPNVGHLEAGAGAVGFIKAVMSVQRGLIPPQANLETLNSRIRWDDINIRVVQDATKWPVSEGPRRAGVCSYGYGGTVSHAVIEAYDTPNSPVEVGATPKVLLLSSPQERNLAAQANALGAWILTSEDDLDSVATTLGTRRSHHDYRTALIVDDRGDAQGQLKVCAAGQSAEWVVSGRVLGDDVKRDVVWVYSGHGAQWADMAKALLKVPAFYAAVSSLDSIVEAEAGFSALRALEDGDFESSDRAQVVTYLMQVGLTALLRSKGVTPGAVIGHSVGEIAASVAAGSITPEEGAHIVASRARLYRQVMGRGAMILVQSPAAHVERELLGSDLAVAIDSSPSSCVVSGPRESVDAFADGLAARDIKFFRVKTDVAFHHSMLEELSEPLSSALVDAISPQQPEVVLYSTSAPDPRSAVERDAVYWTNNMVGRVRLTSAVEAAAEDGYRLFLEVASHPIVSHSIKETLLSLDEEEFGVMNTMARGQDGEKTVLRSIAQLHCRGADVNWKQQMSGRWSTRVPTTTWSHKPYWRKVGAGPRSTTTMHQPSKHTLLGQRIQIAGEDTIVYSTKVDEQTRPFPGRHPLHGSEIVPAAALINTLLHGTGARTLSNITLRVPVAVGQPRDVQVVVQPGQAKICSRLAQEEQLDETWLTHTTGQFTLEDAAGGGRIDIEAVRSRAGTKLADNFSINYLDQVGVSAMGFPWAVTEHHGSLEEMIARVDVAPQNTTLPWDAESWAPILDAATSVGSTIFFDQPRLRMPAHIGRVTISSSVVPPKIGYLYVEKAASAAFTVHVTVCNEHGDVLARIDSMRFSEIEGTPGVSGSVESLVHQVAWLPAQYNERPLPVAQVILVSEDRELADGYALSLRKKTGPVTVLARAGELEHLAGEILDGAAIVYIPGSVSSLASIPAAAEHFIAELLATVRFIADFSRPAKVFVLSDGVFKGNTPSALAQAPLHGLSRIIASEHPELWGALIDLEAPIFPLETMKYVQGADNVRVDDGIPRVARLRSLSREMLLPTAEHGSLLPRPEGTYLITGGLGALGLEVASFLVERGARRLVLVSRRALPPRGDWPEAIARGSPFCPAIESIKLLESSGATVHAIALDISRPGELSAAIEELHLPPVLGVVHAAGVLEDQLVLSATRPSFQRVLAPKVSGALALHSLFPVKMLDFMILFSSCGQLFGFPGQASYASGNAFLDALATHRRIQGDNTVAIQWTSWRGMGMAASTEFINAELASKGITDITRDEAFRAWVHISQYSTSQVAVLRSLVFEAEEPLPSPMLVDIAVRKAVDAAASRSPPAPKTEIPTSIPERKAYLDLRIRECVAQILQLGDSSEVDSKVPLSNLGVDSVMTVSLRVQLQKALGVKVPPTLVWSFPTVAHLVGWFLDRVGK